MTSSSGVSPSFFLFAISSILILSGSGSICSLYLLLKFGSKKDSLSGFQKFCMLKSVANLIISTTFLFWIFPITALSIRFADLNYTLSKVIGVISASGSFFFNYLMNLCTSCNRFFALCFPFGLKRFQTVPFTPSAILASFALLLTFCFFLSQEGCSYIYDPDVFRWRREYFYSSCRNRAPDYIPTIVFVLTGTTNLFNLATFVRLQTFKTSGLKQDDVIKRKKKWKILFVQSFIQDCCQFVPIVSSYFVVFLMIENQWFQFICVSFVFMLAVTLDALIMIVCHVEFHPAFMKRLLESRGKVQKTSVVPLC